MSRSALKDIKHDNRMFLIDEAHIASFLNYFKNEPLQLFPGRIRFVLFYSG